MTDRRSFVASLAALAAHARRWARAPGEVATDPVITATPTPLYQQPDGRNNLVRVTVTGLDAPAARTRVTSAHGVLVGTAGLLPRRPGPGAGLSGEVWLPLAAAADFQFELEVGKRPLARRRLRLVPPRRWTLYWLSSSHTDVGNTDLQERALEVQCENLDAALARLATHPDYRWTAECALQVLAFVENRSPAAGAALAQALRDGKLGWSVLFANLLTGLLDHETLARSVWPAGRFAREQGLGFRAAQLVDVPGQVHTFPMLLAASGVRYLVTGVSPMRAVPLCSAADGAAAQLAGEWTRYPQLYWWEGPDGSRVLHWRGHGYADALRLGFDQGVGVMARRVADWLLSDPTLSAPDYPADVALVHGAAGDNGLMDERLVATVEDFNRRYAFPRIVPGRAEDFFHAVEQGWRTALPVRRGDTGLYREDGAASTAAELARYRAVQLSARAAELLALWDDRTETRDADGAARRRRRAAERRACWEDVLLFGEHTWGAAESVTDPDGRETVAQWEYKRRFLDAAGAAASAAVAEALLRLGRATDAGPGRVVFNASSWPRSDVLPVPGGAGRRLDDQGRSWPAVDMPDGSALVVARDVPALGYVALAEGERAANPPQDEGAALEAQAGGFHVALDPATGAIRSLTGSDGLERVRAAPWSGLNQLLYVTGGERSALWTEVAADSLRNAPELMLREAQLRSARRERLPGVGVRLVIERTLEGADALTSIVTLYDELAWVDIENQLTKPATLDKEALYVAFPFALTRPVVEIEVPLGRLTVERDQQPGSCRDWYCHTHWVWLHDATTGVLWSGPDTPLLTLNDLCRGQWRRTLTPDGTLFAYALHNYWPTNFAARQGGALTLRFRLSLLAPGGDPVEPVRRGWAACDPLRVSERYTPPRAGPLLRRDWALAVADPGVLVIGAKPADDGEGAILKLLDVSGTARRVAILPAAYSYRAARRANLVEMNGDPVPVAPDGRVTVELSAWGTGALRLFTPREGVG